MFGTVLTLSVTALHAYVLWRARSVPYLRRPLPSRLLLGGGLLLWGVFLAGRSLRHSEAEYASVLEGFGMTWMGSVFLAAVCLALVDLGTGFGRLFRSRVPLLRAAALAGGLALSAFAWVQGTRLPVVEQHEVVLRGLPPELDGTVLVAVSDTHLGAVLGRRWLEALVERIGSATPDLVVFVGDVFEGHGPAAHGLATALDRLAAPLGVYAVPGNHDFHGGLAGDLRPLAEAGHRVLRDEWVRAAPGLVVAGVDDLTTARRRGRAGDAMARALEGRPAGGAVLLSHIPWEAEAAAAAGAGLMVSGHTHAGQLWPFGHLVARRYPLLEGRYLVDGMPVLVSRGAGTWGPRMRLWRPGEILRITLRAPAP